MERLEKFFGDAKDKLLEEISQRDIANAKEAYEQILVQVANRRHAGLFFPEALSQLEIMHATNVGADEVFGAQLQLFTSKPIDTDALLQRHKGSTSQTHVIKNVTGPYYKPGVRDSDSDGVKFYTEESLDTQIDKVKAGRRHLLQHWKDKEPEIDQEKKFPDLDIPNLVLHPLERQAAVLYYALIAENPADIEIICEYEPYVKQFREQRQKGGPYSK